MSFLDLQLFFGFPLNKEFENRLSAVNPHALQLFVNNENDDYLQECNYNGQRFFGKFLGQEAFLEDLELLENHIYSIAKRLVAEYNFTNTPATIIAIPSSHEN